MKAEPKYVALVDDHVLLRQGLANLVNSFPGYKVMFEADHGQHFIEQVEKKPPPVAVLLDVSMPVMDGFTTAAWIKEHLPQVKVLALSMMDDETAVIRMLQSGAHGYILKNTTPQELQEALDTVIKKGYYLNDTVGSNLIASMSKAPSTEKVVDLKVLNEKELEFIRLCSTELTYNEIAREMSLSPKSMDFYKTNIEKKTGIKNRVTLVLFALKHGLVKL
ncbi:MAG: DNA-binding response regulator [Chitinophagaceae bacterium]|jgi:DNA-binding NarL/FixJ family response regulator|nr:DNA-binding response regulator [Chitinophagaceae bacterium]